MSQNNPFDDPRLLVENAKGHIDRLEAGIQRFRANQAYTTFVEPNVEKTEYVHKLRLAGGPDRRLKAVAADAANNLRSALDHVASESARLNGASKITDIHFPFRATAAELELALAHKSLAKKVPAETLAYFRALKPYKGGNDRLYVLTQISNRNKHWSLTPMIHDTFAAKVFLPGGGERLVQTMDDAKRLINEVELFTSVERALNYRYTVLMNPEVYFDGVGDIRNPAVPLLRHLSSVVEKVIDDCAAICQRLGLL